MATTPTLTDGIDILRAVRVGREYVFAMNGATWVASAAVVATVGHEGITALRDLAVGHANAVERRVYYAAQRAR